MVVKSDTYVMGTKSGALIIDKSKKSPAQFSQPEPNPMLKMGEVALWGNGNDLPQKMWDDIEATGILSSAIDAKARIAVGKGPIPVLIDNIKPDGEEELTHVNDAEILDWLDSNNSFDNSFAIAKDAFATGNPFAQILLNRDRKIVGYRRHDAAECRFSVKDPSSRKSEFVFISSDWRTYINWTKENTHMDKIPLLDINYPLYDLQSRSGYTFMMSLQYPLFNRAYYSPAPWYAAKQYVDIAKNIPGLKAKMLENQMVIKYVVTIHPKHWEHFHPGFADLQPKEAEKVQNDFYDMVDEYLTGTKNAYKSLFSTKVFDNNAQQWVETISVTELDDKTKDGKLLPDAASANSEILFALMMNPALMGVDIPGGGAVRTAGSGSNIRESYLVQVMMLEMERRTMSKIFNLAKQVNGWQQRFGNKPLVLRYPNQILTTLNTGAPTAPQL